MQAQHEITAAAGIANAKGHILGYRDEVNGGGIDRKRVKRLRCRLAIGTLQDAATHSRARQSARAFTVACASRCENTSGGRILMTLSCAPA